MSANRFCCSFVIDVTKVVDESFPDFFAGLANILFVASGACDAVYEVVTAAGYVFSGNVGATRCGAFDVATPVEMGTISAFSGLTFVERVGRARLVNGSLWALRSYFGLYQDVS